MINGIKNIGYNLFELDLRFVYILAGLEEKFTLKPFFKFITKTGDGILYAVIGTINILFFGENEFHSGLALAFGFSIEIPIYKIIKYSVKRIRPFEKVPELNQLVNVPDKYSFPSGHTAAAFLFASILSHQIPVLTVPLFLYAVLVGFSRIYMRVHFPTDVLFGALLGLSSAYIGLWLSIH
jgi:undecaprenyl-diphosphatase